MFTSFKKTSLLITVLALSSAAQASTMYKLKITNGSGMPISPVVAYVTEGQEELVQVGRTATAGFTKLCQTGNGDTRLMEIQKDMHEVWSDKTTQLTFPGQSVEITVPVKDANQSIHFEAMYGKSKDTCAIFSISAAQLMSAKAGQVVFSGRDEVVSTGMFMDPMAAMNDDACKAAPSAVDCLRAIASPSMNMGHVRFFPGYLPSVVSFLEAHYGAADTQTLVIPTSGALRVQIIKE